MKIVDILEENYSEELCEELKEAKAIKYGKITPQEYAKGEKMEGVHKRCGGAVKKKAGGMAKPKRTCK